MTDDITVYVFEGAKLMDIYDKTTGFPRLDEELKKDEARERNKEIEFEIENLRATLSINGTKLRPEQVQEINEEISALLQERDVNTFQYGLAGKRFDDLYLENNGADRDGEVKFPEIDSQSDGYKGSEFNRITSEMLELYSQKNADYGDAFAESLDEDGLLVSKIRLKDKLKRFAQLIENDALVNDESMRDTLIDLANYTVMTLMWLDKNE